jgi:protein-S-isoprenylcysteine O-methyltransferase Ste14
MLFDEIHAHIRTMALTEEFEKTGNWLFRWRSFLPLVLYVLAAMVIAMEADSHQPIFNFQWAIICLMVSMWGQIIRAITIGYTPKGTSGRNTKMGQVAEVLNTKGIYSIVRHPLYLGNFFMWLGIIMYVGNHWFTIVCVLLFWLYYERIMLAEEQFLRRKFGVLYEKWAEKIPPFFPSFTQYKSSGDSFSLRNVLKREYSGFFAVFLSFALLDALKTYTHIGITQWQDVITNFWGILLLINVPVFFTLRFLKKNTKLLDVAGREYSE